MRVYTVYMSDEVVIGAKTYISSKRASESTGYAQDYIGQLARNGLIDAQRIGGLWYVALESLETYKDAPKTVPPQADMHPSRRNEPESLVNLDGQTYISASRASELSGYNQDYVGQLARSGKILSRQVGNRWFVEQTSLLAHKEEKDRLLAAVQTESVKLYRPSPDTSPIRMDDLMTYHSENADLLPQMGSIAGVGTQNKPSEPRTESSAKVPIRVLHTMTPPQRRADDIRPSLRYPNQAVTVRKSYLPMRRAIAGAALTVVVVLSFGYAGMKNQSLYTQVPAISQNAFGGSLYDIFESTVAALERFLTKELIYIRKD